MKIETSTIFNEFDSYVKSARSFCVTGLTSFLRMLVIKKTLDISKKKVLFVTSTEQSALKYQNDLLNNKIQYEVYFFAYHIVLIVYQY